MKAGFLTVLLSIALGLGVMVSCTSTAAVSSTGDQQQSSVENNDAVPPVAVPVPKVKEVVEYTPPAIPEKKPKYGQDSAQCVMNYYLYRQSFRDWENSGDMFYFNDLLPYWTYVFQNCPGFRINTFINGARIYEHRISLLPAGEKRPAIDTLMLIFDERVRYFGDKPSVIGLKATALVQHRPENNQEVFDLLKEVIELNKLNTPNHLMVFYMQYAVNLHEAGTMPLEDLIEVYIEVDGIARHNITNNKAESKDYRESIERIEQLMLDYLDCDVMQSVFMPQYLADSTNLELNRRIMGLMAYKQCYAQPVFRRALNQLNRTEPTPRLLMFQGNLFYSEGNYPEALKAYGKAINDFGVEQKDERYEAHMKTAEIHLLQRNYQQARAAAYSALENKPDDAEATVMLGDIYFQGRETCGSSWRAQHAGAWAAWDKYQRARSLSDSPSVQNRANTGIQNARNRFPNSGQIHFQNERTGQSFTAPCWINETVTIRASDS
jgi:tetratricopeptide (TPR) repeat protein